MQKKKKQKNNKKNLDQKDLKEQRKDKEKIKDSCPECEEYKNGWLRAQADYKNLQKEISEQRGEWARLSEQQILQEFIPIYDNFKKAFFMDRGEDAKWENWAKGIEYIMKQFSKVLEDHDVVEIKTSGQKFDPNLHEAVGEEDSDDNEGTILREVDAGYKMGGKVLKVAKVIVAK